MALVKIEPVSPELADFAIQGEEKYLVPKNEDKKMFPECWESFLENLDLVTCVCQKVQGYVTRGSEFSCSIKCLLAKKAGWDFHQISGKIERKLIIALTAGHGARVIAKRNSHHDNFRVVRAERIFPANPGDGRPQDGENQDEAVIPPGDGHLQRYRYLQGAGNSPGDGNIQGAGIPQGDGPFQGYPPGGGNLQGAANPPGDGNLQGYPPGGANLQGAANPPGDGNLQGAGNVPRDGYAQGGGNPPGYGPLQGYGYAEGGGNPPGDGPLQGYGYAQGGGNPPGDEHFGRAGIRPEGGQGDERFPLNL